jgi:uncharacterized membrane protein YagU involved in acid resistance
VKPNIGRAILGGFVGTALLTLMTLFVAPMMTGQKMDMAAKLSEMMGTGLAIGMLMHFLIGSVVFALIYGLVLFRFLPGAPWIKGVISGVIFWLGLEIVAMPMMGGGVFSSQMGGMKAVMAALIAHLVYGAALGGIAGAAVAIRSQGTP